MNMIVRSPLSTYVGSWLKALSTDQNKYNGKALGSKKERAEDELDSNKSRKLKHD